MRDDTFNALVGLYVNREFCMKGFPEMLTAEELAFFRSVSAAAFTS